MRFQNKKLEKKIFVMTKQTKMEGAVDIETKSYEYETIFQIS